MLFAAPQQSSCRHEAVIVRSAIPSLRDSTALYFRIIPHRAGDETAAEDSSRAEEIDAGRDELRTRLQSYVFVAVEADQEMRSRVPKLQVRHLRQDRRALQDQRS
ncbi:hypothetical protein MRB53_038927 [Persea americana]|nr:hypothetical protein MRB53_038927 [Persea americana]